MKIYVICCFPSQILYWERSYSWDIDRNDLSQSDCRIFELIISEEQVDEIASFLAFDPNSQKLKIGRKFFSLNFFLVKNGCRQSGLRTPKLTVSQERTDGINWFFAGWYKFIQTEKWLNIFGVCRVRNGCSQPGHETLKLTVS